MLLVEGLYIVCIESIIARVGGSSNKVFIILSQFDSDDIKKSESSRSNLSALNFICSRDSSPVK